MKKDFEFSQHSNIIATRIEYETKKDMLAKKNYHGTCQKQFFLYIFTFQYTMTNFAGIEKNK